ncbi:MAG: tRNA pseudouridine(38-40) synthase TruA [Flavobacteriaceae bacterium]|nr:MAG: tRNA pseudouridine(38-40) synthase TruA [Flavobacteriaceae bacterium]
MRYFIELSYNGKHYHGWQIQPGVNSIQKEVNKALSTVLQEEINVVGAGRTDTGVHAVQMIAHFNSGKAIGKGNVYKFNSVLPDDITICDVYKVNNKKHARFDAVDRSYEYRIWLGRNVFLLDTTMQIHHQKIDIGIMNEACKKLIGHKDFKAFSKVQTEVHTFFCDITKAIWKQEGNKLTFYITANRFLRNMVRAIVGTLLDVGTGKIDITTFEKIIESKNRSNAGISAPAKGLFLTGVNY